MGKLEKLIILVLMMPFSATASADVIAPEIPETSREISGFAPEGWFVELESKGDLNGDGRADLALIIRKNDSALILKNDGLGRDEYDSNPRSIVIALQQKDGDYRRVAQNDLIIPVIENATMDDPIDGISVDKGNSLTILKGVLRLRIGFWSSAGSWSMFSRTFSFRLDEAKLALIGYDSFFVHRGSGELVQCSINYLTRRMKVQKGSISDDDIPEQWSRLKSEPLIQFADIENGFDFEPGCE